MHLLAVAAAVPLAAVAGVASASLVTGGARTELPPDGRDPPPAVSEARGSPVADPRGGPPWAVRILGDGAGARCIEVGRVAGRAFGPADAAGRVLDTKPLVTGSCAAPGRDPLQVALAQYLAGSTPRSVLFGVAEASVASVAVVAPGPPREVALDASRTFVVIRDGPSRRGGWKVVVTMDDRSSRIYRL
jgi:hypothetical protein